MASCAEASFNFMVAIAKTEKVFIEYPVFKDLKTIAHASFLASKSWGEL